MKKTFTILLFILIYLSGFGQNSQSIEKLQVTGFINNDKIMLRWAPENSISWQRGNKLGYSVYRRVVMRDGKVIEKPDSILLGTFNPLPLERWEAYSDSNYFAVAAEAIYGSGFEVTTQSKGNFFDMVNKSREQESRFSMGLLCADQSFTVARMMGLGLVDSTTKKNEAYLYKVVLNYSDTSGYQEKGFALVDFGFGNFLPRPFGINHEVVENVVTIMVPYEPFKGIYNTYQLQRSDDGKTYRTVKDKSYYSLSTTPDDPKYNIYNDSVVSQASTVFYRLRGRTPFDSYGPYSDTLEVKIMPSLIGSPWITDIKEVGNDKLIVTWDSPEYKPENLKGFMLYSAKRYEGPYLEYFKTPLAGKDSIALIDAPGGHAYLKVGALDGFNRPYFSAPRLYQAVDSIPPSAPQGLTGAFDTTGVVQFKWSYGKERDLLGYQMLYSANADSEYSLIGNAFIYDSTYKTSFPTNMLSSDLFFKVVALDTRYNTSRPSEPIKLVKPDTIAPSSPVIFIDTDSTGLTKILIAPSSSTDIKIHYLYFITDAEKPDREELFRGSIRNDTTITLSNGYGKGEICCVAEDITGRKGYSNRVSFRQQKNSLVSTFNALAKPLIDDGAVELLWDKTNLSGSIMIYRKDDLKPYNLIATVDSQIFTFKDRNVTVNTSYSYKLVGFQRNGKAISRVIAVKYR
ncbi:MAG: hypothetical protein EHM93_04745 [Bacteroidales bacterium]|nr:MAG: hypothetical protein EHM93_04745 [Bacteroidales bacterium]